MIQPTTKAQAQSGSVELPPQLFDHLGQQTQWMTGVPQSLSRYGWAGRVADKLVSQGTQVNLSSNISIGGSNYLGRKARSLRPSWSALAAQRTLAATNNTGYRNGARARATLDLISQGSSDSICWCRNMPAFSRPQPARFSTRPRRSMLLAI
ncbi:MAG: hypothetical protein WDO56_21680 [Gammaproteobacteria bacterium]